MAANITYHKPLFHRRCFANLIDFIIFVLLFGACFLLTRAIAVNTPDYKAKDGELLSLREESGLYFVYSDGNCVDIVSHLKDNSYTPYARWEIAKNTIDRFIVFCDIHGTEGSSEKVQEDYDAYRLDTRLTYKDIPMFIKDDEGNIIENPTFSEAATLNERFELAYAPYIDGKCQAFLVTEIPAYLELTHYQSNMLYFAEIAPSYAFGGILAYLLPTFIFRRGRMTFGKALYRIGLVDRRILVPKIGRSLGRFAIFYFFELLLTPFTFGLPFLVSFSLMAFSKSHQGLPDYLLGLNEVDVSNSKIYFDRAEISLDDIPGNKRPVDFHMEKSQ